MTLQLFERVALKTAIPSHGLRAGDVATLLDFVPHPADGPRGCVLEIFNAVGESLAVLTVPESAIEPLHANEVFSVRTLAASA